jgi:hypothetical protein
MHDVAIWDLHKNHSGSSVVHWVTEDLRARKELGLARYGQPLQVSNGRDPLQDSYDEVLDGMVYTLQAIYSEEPGAPNVSRLAVIYDRLVANALDLKAMMVARGS